jgi:hypothetical protein
LRVVVFFLAYLMAGIHNYCVIPAAEVASDFLEAVAGQITCQVHANLAGFSDALAAFFTLQIHKFCRMDFSLCCCLNFKVQRKMGSELIPAT